MYYAGLFNKSSKFVSKNTFQFKCLGLQTLTILATYSQQTKSKYKDSEEFRVLDLKPKKQTFIKRKFKKPDVMPPRTNVMSVDQDWGNVWPGPRSFHPASVPLPIRQGYNQKGAPPGKFANAELMKIPNFLHLTPPVIKRQCEALKRFCSSWPGGLETDTKCEEAFPLEIIMSDYCHSSPDIRDPLSRIVTLKVKVGRLPLNAHAKDKLQRLVGERYNPENDVLTILTDRCPLRHQNFDYAHYLLTALFHESWKIEAWEKEKSEADMEYYDWEVSASHRSVINLLTWTSDHNTMKISPDDIQIDLGEYKEAVSNMMNEGEEDYIISQYKEKVKKLFSLPDMHSRTQID